MIDTAATSAIRAGLRSPAAKVGAILGLLLLMQIPLFMVSGLIEERETRQGEVLADFQRGWGPAQAVAGPMLMVPYSWPSPGSSTDRLHGWARIPSARLDVTAALQPETRRRGLFHAVIYTAAVAFSGGFTIPDLQIRHAPAATVDWSGARVVLTASDLRGLADDATIDWNGAALPLEAARGEGGCLFDVLSAPAGLGATPKPGMAIPFHTAFSLRGTGSFQVAPLSRRVNVALSSPWPTPSFLGGTLPTQHDGDAASFNATWQIAGDTTVRAWHEQTGISSRCGELAGAAEYNWDDALGVALQEAVPTYLMVSRASKYSVLFLTLSFLTLFLFEALAAIRIHLVQYGLLGLSVSLFALLLVSVAEPLGFAPAYAISTAAVLAQASLYTWSMVGRPKLAAVFAGVLAGLFGFLYVVLSLDSYALLAGTAALFAILSVVMAVTRRVNWSGAPA